MGEPSVIPALEKTGHALLAAAVIVHDATTDQVLLMQRGPDATFAPEHFDLPIGKTRAGESIVSTAVRELHEETGLVVEPESLTLAGMIHGEQGAEAPNGYLAAVFATHSWTGQPRNTEPHKHTQVLWCPTERIPEAFVPTTRRALTVYLNGQPGVVIDGFTGAQPIPL